MKKNIISELVNVSFNFFVCMTFPAYWIQVELRKCIVTFFSRRDEKFPPSLLLHFALPRRSQAACNTMVLVVFLSAAAKRNGEK